MLNLDFKEILSNLDGFILFNNYKLESKAYGLTHYLSIILHISLIFTSVYILDFINKRSRKHNDVLNFLYNFHSLLICATFVQYFNSNNRYFDFPFAIFLYLYFLHYFAKNHNIMFLNDYLIFCINPWILLSISVPLNIYMFDGSIYYYISFFYDIVVIYFNFILLNIYSNNLLLIYCNILLLITFLKYITSSYRFLNIDFFLFVFFFYLFSKIFQATFGKVVEKTNRYLMIAVFFVLNSIFINRFLKN